MYLSTRVRGLPGWKDTRKRACFRENRHIYARVIDRDIRAIEC